jgi:cytochrome oxidase Cu insertion factor (SCO1/SenC/PrrC family)
MNSAIANRQTVTRAPRVPWALLLCLFAGASANAGSALFDSLPHDWIDDQGHPFDLHALRDRPTFVTMAYATCHRICPGTMLRFQSWQKQFDARGVQVEFVIVGYDPESDDAHAWHHYRESRHLTAGNWHFLVGTPQTVRQFAKSLGFEFWKVDEHVMHEDRVVLLDPQGPVAVNPTPGVLLARTNQ